MLTIKDIFEWEKAISSRDTSYIPPTEYINTKNMFIVDNYFKPELIGEVVGYDPNINRHRIKLNAQRVHMYDLKSNYYFLLYWCEVKPLNIKEQQC